MALFGATASTSARDAMEQDSSDWRLFQIPSRWWSADTPGAKRARESV